MPWWAWLALGMAITGIPLAALLAWLVHFFAHFMDGW